jgi:hypothetical protein
MRQICIQVYFLEEDSKVSRVHRLSLTGLRIARRMSSQPWRPKRIMQQLQQINTNYSGRRKRSVRDFWGVIKGSGYLQRLERDLNRGHYV